MSHRWIVKCKGCGAEITFKLVDEQIPETAEPSRPIMMRQPLTCSICHTVAEYLRQDLMFR